jgi:hypothetical protein
MPLFRNTVAVTEEHYDKSEAHPALRNYKRFPISNALLFGHDVVRVTGVKTSALDRQCSIALQ